MEKGKNIPLMEEMSNHQSKMVVYQDENLLKIDESPSIPKMDYYEPDIQPYACRVEGIFQGINRNLQHAQYLYNMCKSSTSLNP